MRSYTHVRWYSTPRQIAAFVEAEADRLRYWRGTASEPWITEPSMDDITRPVAAPATIRIMPCFWCGGEGFVEVK